MVSGGGEYGIRGFIVAYDADTGEEAWRFYTIPGPGEPGHETWEGDDWEHGGASVWVTGSYDADLNLTYWGVGNPGPDWNPGQRPGDNLYSDAVVALDADTGELVWYFQFTPNDGYDYDSVQVPVLVDIEWNGVPSKLMMWANRNGYFYVLDRVTGEFLTGTPFVKVNWSSGLEETGRPIPTPQPARLTDLAGESGRHQLVSAVVQPCDGPLLHLRLGRLRHDLSSGGGRVHPGPGVSRWWIRRAYADTGCAGRRDRPNHADQQLDGRSRAWHGDRHGSEHGRGSLEVSSSSTSATVAC